MEVPVRDAGIEQRAMDAAELTSEPCEAPRPPLDLRQHGRPVHALEDERVRVHLEYRGHRDPSGFGLAHHGCLSLRVARLAGAVAPQHRPLAVFEDVTGAAARHETARVGRYP